MAMAPDGDAVAVGMYGGFFAWVGVADGIVRGEPINLEGRITHMAMAPGGEAVLVGTSDGCIAHISSANGDVAMLKAASMKGFVKYAIVPYKNGSFLAFDSGDAVLMRIEEKTVTAAASDSRRVLQGAWAKDQKILVLATRSSLASPCSNSSRLTSICS